MSAFLPPCPQPATSLSPYRLLTLLLAFMPLAKMGGGDLDVCGVDRKPGQPLPAFLTPPEGWYPRTPHTPTRTFRWVGACPLTPAHVPPLNAHPAYNPAHTQPSKELHCALPLQMFCPHKCITPPFKSALPIPPQGCAREPLWRQHGSGAVPC